jgi:hypothetical protein
MRTRWRGTTIAVRLLSTILCVFLGATLLAQTVTSRGGRIFYRNVAGRETQLSQGPDDRDPALSLDGRSVVFVRVTKTAHYPNSPAEKHALDSEVWRASISSGALPEAILRGPIKDTGARPLTSFFGPQFSPGGDYVYILAEFAATSFALCRVDSARRTGLFLRGGVLEFRVLTAGPRKGQLIAAIRTASTKPYESYEGYTTPYYLLDQNGRTIRRIADATSNLESLLRRYTGASEPSH